MTTRTRTVAVVGLFLAVSGAIAQSTVPEMAAVSAPPKTERIPVLTASCLRNRELQ